MSVGTQKSISNLNITKICTAMAVNSQQNSDYGIHVDIDLHLGSPTSLTQKNQKTNQSKIQWIKIVQDSQIKSFKFKLPHHIKDILHAIPHVQKQMENYGE